MATTTWTYGQQGSGLQFTLVYDTERGLTVTMQEGSMDLNAIYVSDGDRTFDGSKCDLKLPKGSSDLNMKGSGEVWDDMVFLNRAGLRGCDQDNYFLKAGVEGRDSYTLTNAQLIDLLGEDFGSDLSGLTMGVRATSVNGRGSIKAVMDEGVYDPGAPEGGFYISVGRLDANRSGFGAWFDTDMDGVRDEGEAEIGTTPGYVEGFEFFGAYSYSLDNIDFSAGAYTVRVVDVVVHNGTSLVSGVVSEGEERGIPLKIDGFGADDRIIVDMQTNSSDWMGLDGLTRDGLDVFPEFAPNAAQIGDQNNLPIGMDLFQPLLDGVLVAGELVPVTMDGTYGRLTYGVEPQDDQSPYDFSILEASTRQSYNPFEFADQAELDAASQQPTYTIGITARFWQPSPGDGGGQIGYGNGELVTVVGVPLDGTNVEYMVPLLA